MRYPVGVHIRRRRGAPLATRCTRKQSEAPAYACIYHTSREAIMARERYGGGLQSHRHTPPPTQ